MTITIPDRKPCQSWVLYNRITGESRAWLCQSPKCNNAECQECWARRRIAIADNLIKKYALSRFFTLTVDRSHTVSHAWKKISYWWSKFRKRMVRYAESCGVDFKFFAILECHKDGYPHVHGFWNVFIPQKRLAVMWSQCAPGYVVHVRAVDDSKNAADYLWSEGAKYIGKKQAIEGARRAGYRKRTMWRTVGMKTDYELHKKALDSEADPDYTKVWYLDKSPVPVVIERRPENGSYKLSRQDLEAACSAVPERCTSSRSSHLDRAESKTAAMQAARYLCGCQRPTEPRDQDVTTAWREPQERKIVWLHESVAQEVSLEHWHRVVMYFLSHHSELLWP